MNNLTTTSPAKSQNQSSSLATRCGPWPIHVKCVSRGLEHCLYSLEDRPAIIAEARAVMAATEPCRDDEIEEWVLRVLTRYREFNGLDVGLKAEVISDWVGTFQKFPVAVLERMRKTWRESESAAFMPQEGQILKLISEQDDMMVNYYRALSKRVLEQEWASAPALGLK